MLNIRFSDRKYLLNIRFFALTRKNTLNGGRNSDLILSKYFDAELALALHLELRQVPPHHVAIAVDDLCGGAARARVRWCRRAAGPTLQSGKDEVLQGCAAP